MPDAVDPRFDENPTLPGLADPYPIFRAVREADPVHWCPGAKLWAILRYDDAQAILKDPRLSRQAYLDALEARTGPQAVIAMQRHELVFMDNPRHGELRSLIGDAIGTAAVHRLQATIDAIVEQKLAPLRAKGSGDLIADFLLPLPTSIAAAWLGVPEPDRERITSWIFPLIGGRGVTRDPATTAAANRAANELRAYFTDLMRQRRAAPADDLISGLLAAQKQEPSLLSDDDLFAIIVAVFAGGHTPGVAFMAMTLLALLDFPGELARLRADPALLPTLIEEGLRFTSPTQAPNPVAAREDISIRGKTIRQGEMVTVMLIAANRDPEVFPDPDRFDAGRTPNRHLAFSAGAHYCLGAVMNRLQATSVFPALAQLQDLRLECDRSALEWIPHDRFRVLARLPVAFRANS